MTKLWLLERTDRVGYDEYDAVVVAADTELEARTYHPNGSCKARHVDGKWVWYWSELNPNAPLYQKPYKVFCESWQDITKISVSYLGVTDRDIKGVVLASFCAG